MAETTAESQLAHAFNQRLVWHETRRQAMPKSSHLYGSAGSMTYGVGAAANADLGRACKQDVIIQWNGSYSVKQHSCIYNFTLYIYIYTYVTGVTSPTGSKNPNLSRPQDFQRLMPIVWNQEMLYPKSPKIGLNQSNSPPKWHHRVTLPFPANRGPWASR